VTVRHHSPAERGDRSPPLSGDDALGISTATLEPYAAVGSRPGEGEEPDQREADDDTDPGRAASRSDRRAARRARFGVVLLIVGIESLARRIGVAGGDDERPAIEPVAKAMWNAAGGEHCGPLVHTATIRRHTDGCTGEVLHRPIMIDGLSADPPPACVAGSSDRR